MAKSFLGLSAALLLAFYVTSVLSGEAISTGEADNPSVVEEPARIIAVRVFQPHVYGGVMIRGHCGHMMMAHSIPVFARVTIREVPAEDTYTDPSDDGAPWAHGEAEGVAKSIESFFTLSHPSALFREDPSELDRWQNARMRALEAIHSQMLQQAFGDGGSQASGLAALEETASDASGVSQANVLDGAERSATEQMEDTSQVPVGGIQGYYEASNAGVILLGVGFALLVAMLLMSLSTLIYGCAEPEPEPLIYVIDDSVETPLLKGGVVPAGEESLQVGGGTVVNPLNIYEPPKETRQ